MESKMDNKTISLHDDLVMSLCCKIINASCIDTIETKINDTFVRYHGNNGAIIIFAITEGSYQIGNINDLRPHQQQQITAALLNYLHSGDVHPVMQMHEGHLHPTVGVC